MDDAVRSIVGGLLVVVVDNTVALLLLLLLLLLNIGTVGIEVVEPVVDATPSPKEKGTYGL